MMRGWWAYWSSGLVGISSSLLPPPSDMDVYDDDVCSIGADPAASPLPVMSGNVSPLTAALVAKLRRVTSFALGGVGIVGSTSEGERLTLQLSHQPDAITAFGWLANHVGADVILEQVIRGATVQRGAVSRRVRIILSERAVRPSDRNHWSVAEKRI